MGCFGKGCLILFAFLVFLMVAFAGGTYFAVRFLRASYLSTTAAHLPPTAATEDEQAAARTKWDTFEHAARAHTASRIELSADELNALIAAEPDLRGKGYVTINGDTARLQISVPLDHVKLLRGRYMNAEATVQSAEEGDPLHARVTSILLNGQPVGEDTLNWRGPWGYRRIIEHWVEEDNLKTFQITDGKVILESRGE
jgi:hypothetical protein